MAEVREARRVEWLELFFDLVFVVVVAQLTEQVAQHPGVLWMLAIAGLFLAVWASWNNTTLLENRSGQLPRAWRPLIFISMAGVAVMAVSIPSIAADGQVIFAVGYAIARVAMWPLWTRVRNSRGRFSVIGPFLYGPVIALGWIASIALPDPWRIVLWGVLLVAEIVPTIRQLPVVPHDKVHMSERVGLFVMIVLGESVLELIRAIAGNITTNAWIVGALGFAVVCTLWWRYFEITGDIRAELEHSRSRAIFRDIFVGAHYLFVLALIFLAAALGGAIEQSNDGYISTALRVLLITGLALYEVAQVAMALRLGGRGAGWVTVGLAPTVAACLVLALAGTTWSPWLVIAVVLAECVCEIAISAVVARARRPQRAAQSRP